MVQIGVRMPPLALLTVSLLQLLIRAVFIDAEYFIRILYYASASCACFFLMAAYFVQTPL